MEEQKQEKTKKKETEKNKISCADVHCPVHGHLKVRGRSFRGKVIKKFPRRITIAFEKILFVKKYERYMKKKTKIHSRLPDCMKDEINVGDYVEVGECRPLSKIIHSVVIGKIKSGEQGEGK